MILSFSPTETSPESCPLSGPQPPQGSAEERQKARSFVHMGGACDILLTGGPSALALAPVQLKAVIDEEV